mmetsp:Transcript_17841/g.45685  ORF Transcript_17841/g.45685 Transcript_17841/m.45685 type:complete len:124 (-) Transcript_17841:1702-2073(-)
MPTQETSDQCSGSCVHGRVLQRAQRSCAVALFTAPGAGKRRILSAFSCSLPATPSLAVPQSRRPASLEVARPVDWQASLCGLTADAAAVAATLFPRARQLLLERCHLLSLRADGEVEVDASIR